MSESEEQMVSFIYPLEDDPAADPYFERLLALKEGDTIVIGDYTCTVTSVKRPEKDSLAFTIDLAVPPGTVEIDGRYSLG